MGLSGIFAGTRDGDIWHSDDGSIWEEAGSISGWVGSIVFFRGNAYACSCRDDIVYQCTDGSTWESVDTVIGGAHEARNASLCVYGGYLYAVARGEDPDMDYASRIRIRRSVDGTNWSTVFDYIINHWGEGQDGPDELRRVTFCEGDKLYVVATGSVYYPLGTWGMGYLYEGMLIYGSIDGSSWSLVGMNVVKDFTGSQYGYSEPMMAYANGDFYCGDAQAGIDYGPQATGFDVDEYPPLQTASTGYVHTSSMSLYAGDWSYTDTGNSGGFCKIGGNLYQVGISLMRTPIDSISWSLIYTPPATYGYVWQMCKSGAYIYAVTASRATLETGDILQSIDDGLSFSSVKVGNFTAIGAPAALGPGGWSVALFG